MKRFLSVLLAVSLLVTVSVLPAGCKGKPALKSAAVIHEPEFGGVYVCATIDEFNALGFHYGDSVDVVFSNGYALTDVPYYNGYYTRVGDPVFIAYPGYDYVKAAINNGADLFEVAGLSETDTATVTLREAGKYLAIQNARDIHYEDDRSKFTSDEEFANFRAIKTTGIRHGSVYRSASPCDDQHNRSPYVDRLMGDAGVRFILDLADTEEKINGYIAKDGFDSPNFLALYQSGSVVPLALNMNVTSDDFRQKVARGLAEMANSEGPYLIHCTEGKDRTGFVCLLIEALMGASYQEIVDDYMITYQNYYGISVKRERDKYDVIVESVLDPMIGSIAGEGADVKTADLKTAAEAFLKAGGMSEEALEALKKALGE